MFLQLKLEALLSKKIHNSKRIRPDDSSVVVSVNERSERDLIRRFDEVHVDWLVVEKQLLGWGELVKGLGLMSHSITWKLRRALSGRSL